VGCFSLHGTHIGLGHLVGNECGGPAQKFLFFASFIRPALGRIDSLGARHSGAAMASSTDVRQEPARKVRPASAILARDESDEALLRRFATQRDEGAFAALVQRYGPMVLGVCRRVLNHTDDAEDAFQATFLVLVYKASSIRKPELLGNWLYGVACRTARKARTKNVRRSVNERKAGSMAGLDTRDHGDWRAELLPCLDEELDRLPEKYRAPLVLCYLGGMTNEEAARRLGWPAGSISYRLARGKKLLQQRLQMRQNGKKERDGRLTALLAVPLFTPELSRELGDRTVQSAMAAAFAKSAGIQLMATPSVTLAQETMKAMAAEQWKKTAITLLAVLLLGLSIGVLAFTLWSAGLIPFLPANAWSACGSACH
jgi:RNA polymerase sigma factor (sigma-70 family)